MSTFKLQIHGRDLAVPVLGRLASHSGYDLVEYDNDGNVLSISSIDLVKSDGKIRLIIQKTTGQKYTINGKEQVWPDTIYYDDNPQQSVDQKFAEDNHFCTAEISVTDPEAVFNKIRFDAEFRNALESIQDGATDYDIEGPNCNTWTNFIGETYLNETNITDRIPGWYPGNGNNFTSSNLPTDNRNCKLIEDISDKFFAKYSDGFDMNNFKITLKNALDTDDNKNNGFYAIITDGSKTYIFDGDRGSWFENDDGNYINGTNADDYIVSGKGNDNISAGSGNDIVDAGATELDAGTTKTADLGSGNDLYVGGMANDNVVAASGNNNVYLGSGTDSYTGGDGVDIVDGGSGNIIRIKQELNTLGFIGVNDITYDMQKDGTDDINTIHLEGGNDIYTGGIGVDKVWSGSGDDTINTGGGNDIVYTNDNADKNDVNTVFLGSGDDKFYGGDGVDIVDGGSEDPNMTGIYDPSNMVDSKDDTNTVYLGGGNDIYTGGKGTDIVYTGSGNDTVYTGEGDDHVYTNDTTNKDDVKTIHLGGGNDTFTGGVAHDHVTATSNSDTENNTKNINLGDGDNIYVGGNATDNVKAGSGNDNISTGAGNDKIDTGDGKNKADGGAGDDRLKGGKDDDELLGGTGNDTINGGGGTNTIDVGKDDDDDTVVAGTGPGQDIISNFGDTDTLIIPEGISDTQSRDGDLVYTTPSGREVILRGRGEPEDPEDDTPPNFPENVFDGEGTLYRPNEEGKYEPVPNDLPPFVPSRPEKEKDDVTAGKNHAESQASPLVVDLDGDGIETLGTNSGVYFDHDNNSFAERTAWVGKDDGLLARDINGNGQIDNGSELFGNNTILSNGQKAANGFEALKDLDSNNDGVFNSSDTAWNQVKVWKDSNSNGIVDDGELLTLEQANIEGINLNYNRRQIIDDNNNAHKQQGTFIKSDGTTGTVHDVWFDADYANTLDITNVEISNDNETLYYENII